MTNVLKKRSALPRTARLGAMAAGMACLMVLQGCGGGDADTGTLASNAATASATQIVDAHADVRQKVIFAGTGQGFVATALAASLPAGTESDYDILVIGNADQGGEASVEQARHALAEGKEVVSTPPATTRNRRRTRKPSWRWWEQSSMRQPFA